MSDASKTLTYRSENPSPRWYSGTLHLIVTFGIGSSILLYLALHIQWTLTIALIFLSFMVLGNLVEYIVHRWLLHRYIKILPLPYEMHTLMHHQYFCDQYPEIFTMKEIYRVLFPIYGIVFIVLFSALIFSGIAYSLWGINEAYAALFSSVSYFLLYEFTHLVCHLPLSWRIVKMTPFKQMYEHHRIHHKRALMSKWNMNIPFPLWDIIFRTKHR